MDRKRPTLDGAGAAQTGASGAVPTIDETGELAALIGTYWAEMDAFHQRGMDDDGLCLASLDGIMEKMIGVPARTATDASAAMDWIVSHGPSVTIELNPQGGLWNRVCASLVGAVRDYLAARRDEAVA